MKCKQLNIHLIAICTILLTTFLISCTSKIENDLSNYDLSGDVEQVVIAEFEPVQRFGEVEIDVPIRFSVLTFNKQGLFSKREHYNQEGELTSNAKHFHIEDGTQHTYSYLFTDYEDYYKKYEYTYNDSGKLSVLDIYNFDGELSFKYVYEYDEQGNFTEENAYNGDGSLSTKWIYKTNETDNSTTIISYDDEGENIETLVYTFNERNELVSIISEDKDIIEEHERIKRDSNDNWTKIVISENGDPIKVTHRSIVYRDGTITGEHQMIDGLIN